MSNAMRVPDPQRLPGIYSYIRSKGRNIVPAGTRGTVMDMMPLTWFEEGEYVELSSNEWLSSFAVGVVGTSALAFEDDDSEIQEIQRSLLALMASGEIAGERYGAREAKIFPQNIGGTKARATIGAITWIARKKGTTGNDLSVNIIGEGGDYTAVVFLRNQRQPRAEIRFSSLDSLKRAIRRHQFLQVEVDEDEKIEIGEVMLTGGDNGTIPPYSSRLQAFLDVAGSTKWDVISIGINPNETGFSQIRSTARQWLLETNRQLQERRKMVVSGEFDEDITGMDNFYIINTCQKYQIDNEYWLDYADVARLIAGRQAGASPAASLTERVVTGVTKVEPELTLRERQNADDRGLFVLIQRDFGGYMIQRDINSFVSWTNEFNIQWRFNQTLRVLHDLDTRWAVAASFQLIGRVPNNRLETIKALRNNLWLAMEEEGTVTEHDISKIDVELSDESPTTAIITEHDIKIVNAIEVIINNTEITW